MVKLSAFSYQLQLKQSRVGVLADRGKLRAERRELIA